MLGGLCPHQELAAHLPPPWERRRADGDGVSSLNRSAKNLIINLCPISTLAWRRAGEGDL